MARDQRYRQELQVLSNYSSGLVDLESFRLLYDSINSSLDLQSVPLDEPEMPIRFKKLIYFRDATDLSLSNLELISIVLLIFRTRGLSRWLSFNLFSKEIKELEQSYFLSRMSLLLLLFHERKKGFDLVHKHVRYLEDLDNPETALTITQNDYFSAISGVKMILPKVAILSTQSNFKLPSTTQSNFKLPSTKMNQLIPILMESNAKAFLQLLLEYGLNERILNYLEHNYPDARVYLKSQMSFTVSRLPNADLSFDEILAKEGANFLGEIAEDVEIWHQRFLVKKETLFEFDGAGSHLLPFVAGHWQYTTGSKTDRNRVFLSEPIFKVEPIEEAIFLSNRADENWFHLLLDTLPRYLFLKNLSPSIPVLIREDLPATTREFLHKILERPIIELTPNSRLKIKKLHFIAARSTCFDSLTHEVDAQVKFSPKVIHQLVEWIQASLKDSLDLGPLELAFFKRNSRQRRILDTSKIEGVAKSENLEIIEDNEDLYRNQVAIFSKLKMGVIPGGAMLANMVFMKPGSTILCLKSSRQADLELWKKLAEAVGLNYFEVTGTPSYHGRNTLQRDHSNYYISPRKFRRILVEVTRSKT